MRSNLASLFIRFQKFLLIGAMGLAVNMSGLFILTEYLHIYYVASSFVAIEASLVVTFILNEVWTWGDRRPGTVTRRFWKYQAVNGAGLVINLSVLFLLTSLVGVNYLLSNLVGAALAACWNFSLNNMFTWGSSGAVHEPGELALPKEAVVSRTDSE